MLLIYLKPKYLFTSDSLKWKLNWLIYRLQFLFKLPILRGKDRIYMQDHVHWQQMYIYKHEYTFIEDSPNICFNLLGLLLVTTSAIADKLPDC